MCRGWGRCISIPRLFFFRSILCNYFIGNVKTIFEEFALTDKFGAGNVQELTVAYHLELTKVSNRDRQSCCLSSIGQGIIWVVVLVIVGLVLKSKRSILDSVCKNT